MKPMHKKTVATALIGALCAGVMVSFIATGASAQQAQKVEKIEVTGSNIKRVDTETAAPIQIITADDLRRSGVTTIAEALRNLPIANAGSLNDISTSASFAIGSSSISLRGLGAQATLVLLNGRRLASYGLANGGQVQFVNLDTLPLAAVNRIEILKDGASAIYGSEAMAGVVNIILRRDYKGIEASGSWSSKGDRNYEVWRANVMAGFGDIAKDGYNGFVNYEHFDRKAVRFRDSEAFLTRPQYQSIFGTGTALSSNAYPGNYRRLAGTTPGFAGTSIAAPGCTPLVGASCVFDQFADISIVPKGERDTGFAKFSIDFTPTLTGFAEASISKNKTTFTSAPSLLNELGTSWFNVNTLDFNFLNLTFRRGDPNNPYASAVGFRHRFVELGPTATIVDTDAARILGGVRGTAASWDWEAAVLYMKSDTTVDYGGRLRASTLGALIDSGGYNFINPTANSAAVLASISPVASNKGDSSMTSYDFKATRELMQMAGGPLGFAFGLEHRQEKLNTAPDSLFLASDIVGFGANSASGDRNVTSGYIEFAMSFSRSLEAQLALRTDRYSDYGSSTTPKASLKWQVTPALVLRGTYSEGFRAPSLPEISKSFSAGFYNGLVDSRRCPTTKDIADCQASVPVRFGANPDLKAEESKSYTIGAVWEPVKDASIAIDYYRIRRDNEIGLLDPTFLIINEARFPGYVQRGPVDIPGLPGPLIGFNSLYANLGETTVKGLDLDLQHTMSIGAYGRLKARIVANYIDSYLNSPNKGEPAVEYNGTYNQPRIRASASLTWDYANWSVTPSANYTGQFKYIGTPYETCALAGIYDDGCTIKAWSTWNLYVQHEPIKNLALSVSIQNVQDKQPPFDGHQSTIMFNPTYHNPYGRYWTLSASYRFK
jgi:iron complex outermembrane receptor protein